MYLPRKEEVEAIARKNKTLIIACVLLLIIADAGGWLVCRHYDKQAVRENRNVGRTVQSITDDNQRARDNVSTATEQIKQAEQQLDDVTDTISSGQRTAAENQKLIADSQQLIDASQQRLAEAARILADIDKSNQ